MRETRVLKVVKKSGINRTKSGDNTVKLLKAQKEQEWLKENKEAIDKYNERIEKYGCFSDEHRRF